ncbi:MAG TPA: DUF3467 domain-containing protein [bacterium]|nr:DUF3467 domain-containing protein [bacterium]
MSQRPPAPQQGPQLPIELPDDVAQGQYSNLMFMTHSPSEFVLDFARLLPGARKGIVYSRIIMTPQHAKALQELLERNITMFEERHGTIKLPGKNAADPRIGFTPTASAEPNAARE